MRKFCVLTALLFANLLALSSQTVVLDSLEYSKGVYVSPEYMLQGSLSGVKVTATDGNIAGAISTTVRGLNSSFITSNPIWVIDGTVLSDCSIQIQHAFDKTTYGDFYYSSKISQTDFINLYDIESIQVLKNLTETSKYGSRGANGVILITTKKGITEKPLISWHTNVGFPTTKGLTHNHDLSVAYNQKRASLRFSAFYRDFQGNYSGAGYDRNGGARLNYEFKSNNNVWIGFNVFASMGKHSLQSAGAAYGIPTMGLALQGIEIPEMLNSIDGWVYGHDDYANYFRSNGNIYLQLNFLKCLNWKSSINFDVNNSTRYFWNGLETEFGKRFNRTAAIDATSLFSYQVNTELNFDRHFGVYHHVITNVHGSFYGDINRFNKMSGDHFMTEALREKGFSLRESASKPRHIAKSYSTWSVGGNISYAYDKYAGINAVVTADRMTRYDDAFVVYPSVDAWVSIRELAFPSNTVVSSLNLTGGWGQAGYRSYLPYELSCRAIGHNMVDDVLNNLGIVIDNSDPQTTIANYFDGYNYGLSSEWNLGLSAGFLKNRISVDLEYYSKATTETFRIYSFGKQRFEDNFVWKTCDKWELISDTKSISNNGFHGAISALVISKPNFSWNAQLNANTSKSDIHFVLNNYIESFNPIPSFFGGFNSDFKFYGVNVSFLLDGASGFDIYNMNKMLTDAKKEISSDYVEQGDYLRLSRASIGYDIPMKNIKWINNLRVSVTGTNLFTVSKYSGVNPDVNVFGTEGNQFWGIDYGALPVISTILFGIKAEF